MQSRLQLNELPYEIIWGIFNDLPFDFMLGVLPLVDSYFYQAITSYKIRYFEKIILQAVSDRVRASFLLNSLKPIIDDNLFFDSEGKSGELNNQMLQLIYQVLTSQDVARVVVSKKEIHSIYEIILNKIKRDLKQEYLWQNLLTSLKFWFLSTQKKKNRKKIKNIEGLIAFNENIFFNLSGLDLSGFDLSCLSLFGCYTTGCSFGDSKLESLFSNFMELSNPKMGLKNSFIIPNYHDFDFNAYFDNRIVNSSITLYIWHLINTSKNVSEVDKNKSFILLNHIKNNPNLSLSEIKNLYCFTGPSRDRSDFEISISLLFEKIFSSFKKRDRHKMIDEANDIFFDNKKLMFDYIKQWRLCLFEQGGDSFWVIHRLSQMTPNDFTWKEMLNISEWMEGFWNLKNISEEARTSAVLVKFKEMIDLYFPKKIFFLLKEMMQLFVFSSSFIDALSKNECQVDIKNILHGIQMKIQSLLNEKEIRNAKRLLHLIFSSGHIQDFFLKDPEIEKLYYALEYQIYLKTVSMSNRKIILDCRPQLKMNRVDFVILDDRYIFPHVYPQLILYLINDCGDMKAAFEYYQAMTEFNRAPLMDGDDIIFKGIYTKLMSYLRDYLTQSIPQIALGEPLDFMVASPRLYPKIKEGSVKLSFNTSIRFSFFEGGTSAPKPEDAEKENENKKGM